MAKVQQRKLLQQRLDALGPIVLTLGGRRGRSATYQEAMPRREAAFWAIATALLPIGFMAIGVMTLQDTLKGISKDSPMGWVFGVLGIVLCAIPFSLAVSRNILILDASERSWSRDVGTWPKIRKSQGGYTELVGLRFGQETRNFSNNSKTAQAWSTQVIFQDESQPPYIIALLERDSALFTHDEAFADATLFAQRVGLPIEEQARGVI